MKMTGIIMSGNHPTLILEGVKTQTRRVITPQPEWRERQPNSLSSAGWAYAKGSSVMNSWPNATEFANEFIKMFPCPFGGVGDRLWVRETWYWNCVNAVESEPLKDRRNFIAYRADGEFPEQFQNWQADDKWRPSLFMPRWASRITLEITEVRVERLQEITPEDCEKEGVTFKGTLVIEPDFLLPAHFSILWDSLNAKRGYGWEKNPWVWAISFNLVEAKLK